MQHQQHQPDELHVPQQCHLHVLHHGSARGRGARMAVPWPMRYVRPTRHPLRGSSLSLTVIDRLPKLLQQLHTARKLSRWRLCLLARIHGPRLQQQYASHPFIDRSPSSFAILCSTVWQAELHQCRHVCDRGWVPDVRVQRHQCAGRLLGHHRSPAADPADLPRHAVLLVGQVRQRSPDLQRLDHCSDPHRDEGILSP